MDSTVPYSWRYEPVRELTEQRPTKAVIQVYGMDRRYMQLLDQLPGDPAAGRWLSRASVASKVALTTIGVHGRVVIRFAVDHMLKDGTTVDYEFGVYVQPGADEDESGIDWWLFRATLVASDATLVDDLEEFLNSLHVEWTSEGGEVEEYGAFGGSEEDS